MKFALEISTDNAAFEDDCAAEVRRILDRAIDQIEQQGRLGVDARGTLSDANGNRVGDWRMVRERHDF